MSPKSLLEQKEKLQKRVDELTSSLQVEQQARVIIVRELISSPHEYSRAYMVVCAFGRPS